MSEKRDSGAMRRVSGFSEMERVGDYYFGGNEYAQPMLCVLLPGHAPWGPADEQAAFASLPIGPGGPGAAEKPWDYDGNEDAPTLSPSVWCHGHWHGFIRAGRFESC